MDTMTKPKPSVLCREERHKACRARGKPCSCTCHPLPPIVRTNDPVNAHLGAAQIKRDRETAEQAVLELLLKGWATAAEVQAVGGSEGLRRARGLRPKGYVVEARRPPSGRGPWDYRIVVVPYPTRTIPRRKK